MLIGNKQKFGIEVCYSSKNKYDLLEDMLSQADISLYVNNTCITSHENNDFVNVSCYAIANWININCMDILGIYDNVTVTGYENSYEMVKLLHNACKEDVGGESAKWIKVRDISLSYDNCLLPSITFVCNKIGSVDIVWMPFNNSCKGYTSEGSFTVPALEVRNVFRYFIIAVAIKLRDTECMLKSKMLLSRWCK